MGVDFDLVKAEIEKIGADIQVLTAEETKLKWKEIAQRYGRQKKYEFQFWDELHNAYVIDSNNGWEIIAEYLISAKEVYLFFELEDEKNAFFFKYGLELAEVLTESGCRDFYLVDGNVDFLICYNDSNIIFAEGNAKPWLNRVAKRPISNC